MTMFDRNTFDELLEVYLDGDLPSEEAQRLEAFAEADEEAGHELHLARIVQQRLGALAQPICPPDVTRAVLLHARADARRTFLARLRAAATSSWSTILRPSLVVGVFVGLVLAGTLIGRSPVVDPPDRIVATGEMTPEQIEQGLIDAKWTLAFLSNVGRRTATTIRDDVLDQHVVQPVNRALSAAFDNEPNI